MNNKEHDHWEQQLQDVEEVIKDPETPQGIKELLFEWLNDGEEDTEPKVYAEITTGAMHSDKEHKAKGHTAEDCYDLKVF